MRAIEEKKDNNKTIIIRKLQNSKHHNRAHKSLNNKLNKKNIIKKVIIVISSNDNIDNKNEIKNNDGEIIINGENNINESIDDLFTSFKLIKFTRFICISLLIKSMRFIKST